MKRLIDGLLITLTAGLLMTCQQITPLTPPNPVIGTWTLLGWQIYNLPAWYVAYSHADYVLTPTDTLYGSGIGGPHAVQSFTFTQNNTFSESHNVIDWATVETKQQITGGSWTLSDSVITLSIANGFPNKLTYRYSTDQLVTGKVSQTDLISPTNNPKDTIRVTYTVRLFYRRGDP